MPTLENLLARWRDGDQRAAEAIYDLYRERTFRLAFGLLGNREDAEEAAQDALGYALQHIGRFDEKRSRFSTWLYMITVSRSRDILRRRQRPSFSLADLLRFGRQPADPHPGPEQIAEESELRGEVWQALQKLSPVLREAAVLRHWGGHTYREISEIVGCPMKTAQSRVRLAHQRIAQQLADRDRRSFAEEAL